MATRSSTSQETNQRRSLVRALLGSAPGEPLVVQIDRVLAALLEGESGIESPCDPLAVFRSRGLLAPRLLDLCSERSRGLVSSADAQISPAELIAISFAACAFPQRVGRMTDTEVQQRLDAFLEIYGLLQTGPSTTARLDEAALNAMVQAGRLPRALAAEDASLLLSDLSAAGSVGKSAPPRESEERRAGAALYLGTCQAEVVDRIYRLWLGEAPLLRACRKWLATLPSSLVGVERRVGGQPSWPLVQAGLGKLCQPEPPAFARAAVELERMTWRETERWGAAGQAGQFASDVWEAQWDTLNSGFPHYAFRSRLVWWWKQCVLNYRPRRIQSLGDHQLNNLAGPASRYGTAAAVESEFTPELLRCLREGYRLVRTTFFRRSGQPPAGAEDSSGHAEANDRLRQALDALWYHRLEKQILSSQDDEISEGGPEDIKQIAERFPDLGAQTINMLSHRLRLRMWAYALARLGRLTNAEIRSAKRPSRCARRGSGEQPLARETAVLTVASLARCVPPGRSLLGAFTAHVLLHPAIDPQHPDPWDFRRCIRELWHWVTEPAFPTALRADPPEEPGAMSRAGRAAALSPVGRLEEAWTRRFTHYRNEAGHGPTTTAQDPLGDVVLTLRSIATEEELERYLAEPRLLGLEQPIVSQFGSLLGPGWQAVTLGSLQQWKKLVGREGQHWIAPVLYLTWAEGLPVDALLSRLNVDPEEMGTVTALARAVASYQPAAAGTPAVVTRGRS